MIIEHKNKGECEDSSVVNKVIRICSAATIEVGGALRSPIATIEEFDDGDQGVNITIESFPHNSVWIRSVHRFIGELLTEFGNVVLYLNDNKYTVSICTHACDPD